MARVATTRRVSFFLRVEDFDATLSVWSTPLCGS
jgi:hypothetical protein